MKGVTALLALKDVEADHANKAAFRERLDAISDEAHELADILDALQKNLYLFLMKKSFEEVKTVVGAMVETAHGRVMYERAKKEAETPVYCSFGSLGTFVHYPDKD